MTNAQKWLSQNYPNKEEVREINGEEKQLTNELIITNFPQLEKIDVWYNQLTQLHLNICPQLTELVCSDNKLTELTITNCLNLRKIKITAYNNQLINLDLSNNQQLEELWISNNNFSSDLSFLSHLVNLKKLYLDNNNFTGSLEPLRNLYKLEHLDIRNTKISQGLEYLPESVEDFRCWKTKLEKELKPFGGDIKKWREDKINKWKEQGFTTEQIREWLNAGATIIDYEFVTWFRDIKNLGPEWIANYQEDYQILSERFKKYGLCSKCKQLNTGEKWCQPCNTVRLQNDFNNWTSNNKEIDRFIQKYQLEATSADKLLEWIPHEQFTNIEYLAKGGFGEVYKAQWKDGNICYWNTENNQWCREIQHQVETKKSDLEKIIISTKDKLKSKSLFSDKTKEREKQLELLFKNIPNTKEKFIIELENIKAGLEKNLAIEDIARICQSQTELVQLEQNNYQKIVLKSLNNSQNNTEFLNEVAKHKDIDDWFDNIVPCYGLSQDPNGNYLMVMKYMPEGNLRHYLNSKNKELSLADKISQLLHLVRGLKDIHQKNLVHRDFHSGNILKGIAKTSCLITDLGLCKPVDKIKKEDENFGVMPYVAPEIFLGKPYAQTADIYSFGIIAYELLSGLPPYYNREHDYHLGVKICRGLRPKFKIKIPQLLEDLINRCWDAKPHERPTANKLEKTLRDWEQGDKEFAQQLQAAENFNHTLPDNIKFPDYKTKTHSGAVYTSRLLPTKEITELFEQLKIEFSLVEDKSEEKVEEKDLQSQILLPPKN